MEPASTGKRRRPTPSPPPSDDSATHRKKRRLESPLRPTKTTPSPTKKPEEAPPLKRRRDALETPLEASKKRRTSDKAATSPPPALPASPPANMNSRGFIRSESAEEEKEEKRKFPPPPIEIPRRQEDEDEIPKENREDELVAACAELEEAPKTPRKESSEVDAQVRQRVSLRSVQVTPPPSARMLDHKNPPPPPRRPKRRVRPNCGGGIVYARSFPRLALSPLVVSPPSSPRVFRSLENEFAFAMQDTPEIRPRVRPAPRMARGTRRSTRASSRTRRSLDTPTSTMVLRSRQLNPSLSEDSVKPENEREREQRNAQRRE